MLSSAIITCNKPMLSTCSSVARCQGIQRLARRVIPAVRAYADSSAGAGGASGTSAGREGDVPVKRSGEQGSQLSRRRSGRDTGSALARGGGAGGGSLLMPGMPSIFDAMMRPFDELLSMATPLGGMDTMPEGLKRLAVDIHEDEDKYVIKADVPGMSADKVNVWVDPEDNVLRIEAQREESRDWEEGGVRRVERTFGMFARAFKLPQDADPKEITAHVKAGELDVVLPKRKEAEQEKEKSMKIPVKDKDREQSSA